MSSELPHAIRKQPEMCLLVKDTDKERVKKILKEDPVEGLTKVMTLKKLRKNFTRFEDRRTLVGAYDLFLADDRILPYLKSPVGKVFHHYLFISFIDQHSHCRCLFV